MSSRLHYVRNYKMIQQQTEPGYFCGAALGEYADIDGVESERGNWIEPLHTTYYTMVDFGNMLLFNPDDKELLERLRMAGDRLLAWQKMMEVLSPAKAVLSHDIRNDGIITIVSDSHFRYFQSDGHRPITKVSRENQG